MTAERRDAQALKALWGGAAGRNWVAAQDLLDRLFKPFEPLLAEPVGPGARLLDVGCGTGATTVAAARRAGPEGSCVGVDIAEPMVEAARARAEREGVPARFIQADAATHAFEPAAFDLVISRFGVMFFDDFAGAFANLRRAARPGGGLRLIVWRGPEENPFMTTAERAAGPLLPNLPPRDPDAPGQFALAPAERVRGVLEESGWTGVAVEPLDVPCAMPEKDLERYFTLLGPVGRVLHEVDEPTRARVVETLHTAFASYVHGTEVRFTAACWLVRATA
ncbi:class I SAM-dependent methyltransferase [Streptomyces spinoverrucosus]|uniref:class I SAM-dependent methyltransferase n=1 Tax=Streptomyces spinoverrucosus TaxID=284043 RepID=UPI0018C3CC1E|nr:class I SAM-dependent methyltransferase [Streptomyces spinoverrucosus]MBG0856653.1 class I SAM-dependent methyltransferase [Streptomyces spinoverrucosus]